MKDDAYLAWTHKALFSYQMLEEVLKLCIGVSYEIIAASNPSEVDFKFSAGNINDASLGNLARMFANVSKNDDLAEQLKSRKLLKWRNFFAHNAFMHEFMNRASASPFSPHSVSELQQVARSVDELVVKLSQELRRLQCVHAEIGTGYQQI